MLLIYYANQLWDRIVCHFVKFSKFVKIDNSQFKICLFTGSLSCDFFHENIVSSMYIPTEPKRFPVDINHTLLPH